MNTDPDRFPRQVVELASKRAAQLCSNPECGAVTSGPATKSDKSVNVGEAAHIYGAKPGSARYDSQMLPSERRAGTNAIWLCNNCHKLVDSDPQKFPSALLFKWREMHECEVLERLGKTNERLRREVIDAQFHQLGDIGFRARQILIEKPTAWEFRFTAEILQHKCRPVLNRLNALKAGLYTKALERVEGGHALIWLADRLEELPKLIAALVLICNSEFEKAWGDPGIEGSPNEIVDACALFAENCKGLLVWEERVRFARLPEEFEEVCGLLVGVGARALEQVAIVPAEMSRIFAGEDVTGIHEINFVVDLPEGWEASIKGAMERLETRLY